MTPSVWVAIAGLGLAIVVHIVAMAFTLGGLFAKVRAMERALEGADNCAVQLASLNATLTALQAGMDDMRHNVKNLWQALQDRPAARRRPGES
jgi:cell division protein FtsB